MQLLLPLLVFHCLGEGILLPAVSGQATISQAAITSSFAEPTDTKTAETVVSKRFAFGCVRYTSDSSGSTVLALY